MDEPRLQFARTSQFSETQELYPTGEILRRKPYREPRIRFNEPSKYTAGVIQKVDLELEDARMRIAELEKQVQDKDTEIAWLNVYINNLGGLSNMMPPARAAEEATPKVPEAGTDILPAPEPGPAAAPDAAPGPEAPAGIDSEAAPDATPGPAGIDSKAPADAPKADSAAPAVVPEGAPAGAVDDDQESVTSDTNDDLVLGSLPGPPPLPQIQPTD